MEEKDKKAIQRNFTTLVDRTDLDVMVGDLYEKGVFSEQMIEPYKNTNEPSRDRKRRLYREITRRGPHAFRHLVDTLQERGYWDIVRDLDPENPLAIFSKPPNSSNLKPPRVSTLQPNAQAGYVSISNEKNRTKNEMQKNAAPVPAPAPAPAPQQADLDNANAEMPIIPELKVMKSTTFMENNDLKLYHTRGRDRGVLMVFSYINFKDNIEEIRGGVDVDCANLKYLFSEIGFRVEYTYTDLTKQQTIETLGSLEAVLEGAESVFIVVSSHGYERSGTSDIDIRCSDGKLISFLEIISYFSNKRLPKLIGIPKVLIFQTCRGSNVDFVPKPLVPPPPAPPAAVAGGEGAARTDGTPVTPAALQLEPLYTDILIAHSTLPGQVSFRDEYMGSWFIQSMCEVFAQRAFNTHVDELFTYVDICMREKFCKQTSSIDRWGFNKRLYLHPGLYE